MRCNYYNSYYIHALMKQRNKTNGSTHFCISDPSSKHQTLDVPFTCRHMHTSGTDTHVHMHNGTATCMNNQNQNSSNHINLSCRWKYNKIYNNTHYYMSRHMTKPTMWLCAQSDQSSLCAHWVAKDPSFLHADSKDSDQTGQMPRLIWVFAGHTLIL